MTTTRNDESFVFYEERYPQIFIAVQQLLRKFDTEQDRGIESHATAFHELVLYGVDEVWIRDVCAEFRFRDVEIDVEPFEGLTRHKDVAYARFDLLIPLRGLGQSDAPSGGDLVLLKG